MERSNRVQFVRSKPEFTLIEKYLTPKGKALLATAKDLAPKARKVFTADIWKRYGKNRYKKNPESVIVKSITHAV
jgi:hypothetical protein